MNIGTPWAHASSSCVVVWLRCEGTHLRWVGHKSVVVLDMNKLEIKGAHEPV